MFSSLYSALMLVLFALILRGVSLDFRGEVDSPRWRPFGTVSGRGQLPAGPAVGRRLRQHLSGPAPRRRRDLPGRPLHPVNPYGLLGGLLFVSLFLVHGALWLAVKTEGALQARAGAMAARLWPVLLVVAAMFLLGTRTQTPLFDNYLARPVLLLIPGPGGGRPGLRLRVHPQGRLVEGLVRLRLTIVSVTLFGVVGLYPNLLPSGSTRPPA